MIRTVGKIGSLFLLLFSVVVYGEIFLSITDEYGDSLEQVQMGRAFMIEVSLKGSTYGDAVLQVEGMDKFAIQNTMQRYEMINGETTIKHSYSVIALRPGDYSIGPAVVTHNNQKEESNTVAVKVGTQELHTGSIHAQAPTLLRLFADKERVVKGEKVVGTIRFYYTDPSHKLRHFIEQPVEDIHRKKAREPRQGSEEVNGIEYQYVELNWDMYPQKSGTITIPAFGAEYEVKRKRDHMWGGLGRLFGSFSEQKRIYSNAVTLQVDDLPPTHKKIQGVGQFDSFNISAYPPSVAQGEGVIVTIALKGSFDPDQVTFRGLQGVPKELRYYESKESVEEPSTPEESFIKRFEYIVQGMETGNWEIPAQTFDYYDVASHAYKTVKTAPLSITIMPGASKPTVSFSVDSDNTEGGDFFPLVKRCVERTHKKVMPWWLFFLLIAVPFFIWVFQHGMYSIQLQRKKSYRARRSYNAFAIAADHVHTLKKTGNAERLYIVFIELFADKWQLPLASITTYSIHERLHDIGMHTEQLEQWDAFFTAVSEQAFGAPRTEEEIQNLFRQTEEWLKILQQLL